ncbi:MAG: ATP-dependent metalloprotease, partial [Proteobacteria bacterium]|nr:ATP-dependent metalloprotease [Pseudomonadota bacterium]
EKLGPLTYSEDEGEIFLGHSITKHKEVSEVTAHLIDEEIRVFIDRNYARAEKILKKNIDKLHKMADALMKYETIDSDQIGDIMAGKQPRDPEGWDDDDHGDGQSNVKKADDVKKDGAPHGEPPAKPA